MRWLVRRLVWSLVVVWAAVSLSFLVNALVPGDPARLVAGAQARPADVDRIREQLGIGQAPAVQYVRFWRRLVHVGPPLGATRPPEHPTCTALVSLGGSALHVDLGKSYQQSRPVVDLVATRVPRTFALALAALVLQVLFGAGTGIVAATRRGGWVDRVLVGSSVLGASAPTFLIALVLQLLFAQTLRWLPLDGFGKTFGDHALGIVLPAITLGLYGAAFYTRLVRDEMVTLLAQDWVRTARAKGAGPMRILFRHALRAALVPIVTTAGLDFGALMGGAVVTETVFRWPGLGDLAVKAALNRDGPVLLACVITSSVAVVASSFVVDVLQARLDPQLRATP